MEKLNGEATALAENVKATAQTAATAPDRIATIQRHVTRAANAGPGMRGVRLHETTRPVPPCAAVCAAINACAVYLLAPPLGRDASQEDAGTDRTPTR
jgi:hypothetical protein